MNSNLVNVCQVCGNGITNRAMTDVCQHSFCYNCLHEWSRPHNRCPNCQLVFGNDIFRFQEEGDTFWEPVVGNNVGGSDVFLGLPPPPPPTSAPLLSSSQSSSAPVRHSVLTPQSSLVNVGSDKNSNQTYAIDQNQVSETPISTQFENNETSGVNINTDIDECNQDFVNGSETEIAVDVIDSNISADDDVIEQLDNESEPQIEEEVKEVAELKTVDNDNTCEPNIDNVPSTSSTTNSGQKHVQTARRGRGFQGRVIQRQPIVWPTESSGAVNRPSNPNVSQVQANPEVSQQTGRRIRLRGASTKFSTRGDFRGGRGHGRGFHYN